MSHQSGDEYPTTISMEAWNVAMTIDEEVRKFMADCGLRRVEGRSKMVEAIARMVQLAINQTLDHTYGGSGKTLPS